MVKSFGNERIQLSMSLLDAVMTVAEGNPGAITAIAELMLVVERVDPTSALGKFGPLLTLDTYGVYGSDVWLLYKDVCGKNSKKVLLLLRCVQMGVISHAALSRAINDRVHTFDFEELLETLQKRLPEFMADDSF